MDQLLLYGALALVIVAIYFAGRWILGPIDRAAKDRRAPPGISIGDFLCLFVAVQLPLALARRIRSEETESFFWFFVALSWIVAPIVWISCARALSRAGIASGVHRFLFMGLVLPIVYYGLVPFAFVILTAALMIAGGHGNDVLTYSRSIAAWICTGGALVACGIYTNWLCSPAVLNRLSGLRAPDIDPGAIDDSDIGKRLAEAS